MLNITGTSDFIFTFLILDKNLYVKSLRKNFIILRVSCFKKYLSAIITYIVNRKYRNFVSVTGTNGKTSVVNFYHQIYNLVSYKSLSIGSLGVIGSSYYNNKNFFLTSPSILHLYKILNISCDLYKYLAIEASSHGLTQHRLNNIFFNVAGFTNFSEEHISYHKNIKSYFLSKLRLFAIILKEGNYAVLNCDIKKYLFMHYICKSKNIRIISYGKKSGDIKIIFSNKFNAKIDIFGKILLIYYYNLGEFQLFNILCAIGLSLVKTNKIKEIVGNIKKIISIKGRIESVFIEGIKIYVDYSHTQDALKNILFNINKKHKKKIYIIFSCGGERDLCKREKMGKVANSICNYVVVTNDNPRNENSNIIRDAILLFSYNGSEVDKRYKAIKYTINSLKKGNILIICGKGHEKHQIIYNKKIYSSDLLFLKIYKFIVTNKHRLYFC